MSALHQRFLHDVPLRRDHLRRDGRHHRQDHAHERGAGQPHRARDGWLLEVGEAARHQFLPPILLQLCRRARAARVRGRGALLPGVVLLREGEALRRRALGRPSDRRRRPAALRKGPRSARDGDAEGDRRPRFRRYQPARRKVGLPRDALGGAGAQEPRLPVRGNLPQVSRAEGLGKLSYGLCDGVEALHRRERILGLHDGNDAVSQPFLVAQGPRHRNRARPGLQHGYRSEARRQRLPHEHHDGTPRPAEEHRQHVSDEGRHALHLAARLGDDAASPRRAKTGTAASHRRSARPGTSASTTRRCRPRTLRRR